MSCFFINVVVPSSCFNISTNFNIPKVSSKLVSGAMLFVLIFFKQSLIAYSFQTNKNYGINGIPVSLIGEMPEVVVAFLCINVVKKMPDFTSRNTPSSSELEDVTRYYCIGEA
jgi:hypothetical protein